MPLPVFGAFQFLYNKVIWEAKYLKISPVFAMCPCCCIDACGFHALTDSNNCRIFTPYICLTPGSWFIQGHRTLHRYHGFNNWPNIFFSHGKQTIQVSPFMFVGPYSVSNDKLTVPSSCGV